MCEIAGVATIGAKEVRIVENDQLDIVKLTIQ
jgi:hypothetical protein